MVEHGDHGEHTWFSDSTVWQLAVGTLRDSYVRLGEIMAISMDWRLLPALLQTRAQIPILDTEKAHPRYVKKFAPRGARRGDKKYVRKPKLPPLLGALSPRPRRARARYVDFKARGAYVMEEGKPRRVRGEILRRVLAISHIHLARRYTSEGFGPLSITEKTTPYLLGRCLNKQERINYAARDGFIKRTCALWEVRAAEKGIEHSPDPAEKRFRSLRNHYSHDAGRRIPRGIGTGKLPAEETEEDVYWAILHPETLNLFSNIEAAALADLERGLDAYADIAAYEVFRLYKENGKESTALEDPDCDLKERKGVVEAPKW